MTMTPEQLAKCREAFEADCYCKKLDLARIGDKYLCGTTYFAFNIWQAAWSAAQGHGWLPIDAAARQGQEVLLGGWVNGEWVVMRDDWYVDRQMADWREWPAYNDEPPTHYLPCPTPPEQPSSGEGE